MDAKNLRTKPNEESEGSTWNLQNSGSSIDPNLLNLRQLRVELKRLGLSPSGLKAELRRRLKNAWGISSESPHNSDDDSNGSNISSKGDSSPERRISSFLDDSDVSAPLSSPLRNPSFSSKNRKNNLGLKNREKSTQRRTDRKRKLQDSEDEISEDEENYSDAEWQENFVSSYSSSSSSRPQKKAANGNTTINNVFLEQAQLELFKINLQRQHDAKIKIMNQKIQTLGMELQKKEETVQDLRRTLKERTQTLSALGVVYPSSPSPSDLGNGFGCLQTVILEKLNKENKRLEAQRTVQSV